MEGERPRELRALLDREGEVVVTKDGRPFAIMSVPLVTGNLRHFPPACRRSIQVLTPAQFVALDIGC